MLIDLLKDQIKESNGNKPFPTLARNLPSFRSSLRPAQIQTTTVSGLDFNRKVANSIKSYWQGLGYDVSCEVVPVAKVRSRANLDRERTVYGIQTDMINGLPQKFVAKEIRVYSEE